MGYCEDWSARLRCIARRRSRSSASAGESGCGGGEWMWSAELGPVTGGRSAAARRDIFGWVGAVSPGGGVGVAEAAAAAVVVVEVGSGGGVCWGERSFHAVGGRVCCTTVGCSTGDLFHRPSLALVGESVVPLDALRDIGNAPAAGEGELACGERDSGVIAGKSVGDANSGGPSRSPLRSPAAAREAEEEERLSRGTLGVSGGDEMRAEGGTCTVRTLECCPHLSIDRAGEDAAPPAWAKIVHAREAEVDNDDEGDGENVRPDTPAVAVNEGEADGDADPDVDVDGSKNELDLDCDGDCPASDSKSSSHSDSSGSASSKSASSSILPLPLFPRAE